MDREFYASMAAHNTLFPEIVPIVQLIKAGIEVEARATVPAIPVIEGIWTLVHNEGERLLGPLSQASKQMWALVDAYKDALDNTNVPASAECALIDGLIKILQETRTTTTKEER